MSNVELSENCVEHHYENVKIAGVCFPAMHQLFASSRHHISYNNIRYISKLSCVLLNL